MFFGIVVLSWSGAWARNNTWQARCLEQHLRAFMILKMYRVWDSGPLLQKPAPGWVSPASPQPQPKNKTRAEYDRWRYGYTKTRLVRETQPTATASAEPAPANDEQGQKAEPRGAQGYATLKVARIILKKGDAKGRAPVRLL